MTSQATLFPDVVMRSGAIIDGPYRYTLWRNWGTSDYVNFIMLNPSTANAEVNDPTIVRCINFARSWDFGGLIVTNLFALRATNPKRLKSVVDPVGPANDKHILDNVNGRMVVCAWGNGGGLHRRNQVVAEWLRSIGTDLRYLRLTSQRVPCHPLYLPGDLRPTPWERTKP